MNKIKLVYFSPTGTTRKILEAVANGIQTEKAEHIDLTLPKNSYQPQLVIDSELTIFGVPVYGGRVPANALERLKGLKGNNTPAVITVVYGNREFEDALKEITDFVEQAGFKPVAGGAFIGEHSFASESIPVANGRPDSKDLAKAADFGKKIREKLNIISNTAERQKLNVPGNYPYKETHLTKGYTPITVESDCTQCEMCVSVCPTAAIRVDDTIITEKNLCITCCACIKNCPTQARQMKNEMIIQFAQRLNKNCSTRKEPEIFL